MEAAPKPHLHVVNTETGEAEAVCADCQGYQRIITGLMRQRTKLENQLADRRQVAAEAEEIIEVLTYWRDRCTRRPGSVVFAPGGDRWEKVRDRLADQLPGRDGGWTTDELKLAVDGALISPFHNGTDPKTKGRQYLDARTIFKNAEVVGGHVDRALKFNDLVGVLPSVVLRSLIGLDMKTELELCDCSHPRLLHVGVQETGGREVCKRCDCGGFSSASQPWGTT